MPIATVVPTLSAIAGAGAHKVDLRLAVCREIARRDAAEVEQSPEVKQLVTELQRAAIPRA